ncbi:porin [Agarivorans sp. B2Z047]|uniref:porin n=1 Tax=Agarivorans sp. B2Z047 TaxID=2652721 RepID=UPI00128CECB2|nr:porin [Agarivorans sp. B2Z047]MPW29464.1 porin [Agarivorans sp. B2Z047]UQN45053.1 porin [Agarivorans sp. B2Z047]
MKKTILAVAIPALFAASAQAATVYDADGVTAEVYGRMQFDIDNNGTDTNGDGSARMGFKAKSEIAPGVAGLARGEWQINAESSKEATFAARHVYAGFEFDDAGTVVFGQTDTAFYQAVAATDIFNTYGYEAFTLIEDGRQEGQIVYNGEFGGFYVGASYQFRQPDFNVGVGNPEDPDYIPLGGALDSGYAGTLGYNFDFGLGLYGGYHVEKFEEGDKKNSALSATYSWEDLYLGAVYVATDAEGMKLQGYDLVASYDINAVSLYTGYAFQEGKGDLSDLGDTAKAFKLGAAYKFNSNMKAWAEYLNDGLENADNQWTVAIQYNF